VSINHVIASCGLRHATSVDVAAATAQQIAQAIVAQAMFG
jgi:hypothetical protein